MQKIYIECSASINSAYSTGIQRVVRNITKHAQNVSEDIDLECNFVAFEKGNFFILDKNISNSHSTEQSNLTADIKWLVRKHLPKYVYSCLLRLKKIFFVSKLFKRINKFKSVNSSILESDLSQTVNASNFPPILILLDATWNNNMWPLIAKYRAKGLFVCAVLYDLIPFYHPDTVEESTRLAHTSWWMRVPENVDSIICISDSVRREFLKWQDSQDLAKKIPNNKVDYFTLGSDLKNDDKVVDVVTSNIPFFMVVGSLEPRKNHKLVLDAFEVLWALGYQINLVIIYSHGWKCEELLLRMQTHSEFGSRLILINDASDRDLSIMYERTHGLVMASFAEGFGLPIVEALHRGVKVICSDIPVFHEVAGLSALYFSPYESKSLVSRITYLLSDSLKSQSEIKLIKNLITWQDSAKQLIEKTMNLSNI